jgi:ribosomal protein L40E
VGFVGYGAIFAVDLSKYRTFGAVLGTGLALGLVIVLIIGRIIIRNHRKRIPTGIVVPNVQCSKCRSIVLSGHYCSNCGKLFNMADQYIEEVIECPNCNTKNQKNVKNCRICGMAIENSTKSASK